MDFFASLQRTNCTKSISIWPLKIRNRNYEFNKNRHIEERIQTLVVACTWTSSKSHWYWVFGRWIETERCNRWIDLLRNTNHSDSKPHKFFTFYHFYRIPRLERATRRTAQTIHSNKMNRFAMKTEPFRFNSTCYTSICSAAGFNIDHVFIWILCYLCVL